ncbi:Polysaccharide deacetylase [Herminiimonas arsenicoxydans]|uniref:Polysaccharide deacetylase n=1 Tax=Herminiimonas arsenicoxydans TaxID=204773 RepID=A4G904_HERAR|nr:Polysaccharide deacetylase [Herminiimonas arsenicoxydans]
MAAISRQSNMRPTPKWQASPFLKASVALHVGAVVTALLWPHAMGIAIAAVIANHLALAAAGLWPRSTLLGSNVLRLPNARAEVALTIDDGPDPDITPQVLDILKAHGIQATFFCIAAKVQRYPELAQRMVAAGHHIENHSMVHRHNFSVLGLNNIKKELAGAQHVIEEVTGRRPLYFRAPAGLRNLFLDPVLHQLGLQLVSWTRRGFDTRVGDAQKILDRLLDDLKAGDILLLHDANAARGSNGRAVILDVLPELIARVRKENLQFVKVEDGMRP